MSGNRKSVTLRFGQREWNNILAMCTFYALPNPKDVVQLSLDQLILATNQLQKKLKEAQDNAESNPDTASDSGARSSSDPGAEGASAVPASKPVAG